MTNYKIVENSERLKQEQEVRELMKEGWILEGELYFTEKIYETGTCKKYIQTMIKK